MECDTGSALVNFLRNGRRRGALGANARQKNRARRERTYGCAVGPSDVRAWRDAIYRCSRHSRFPPDVRILVGRLEREDRARTQSAFATSLESRDMDHRDRLLDVAT